MKKGKVLLLIGGILVLLGLTGYWLSSDRYEESRALKKEQLKKYTYSSGGDMNGSSHSEVITRIDAERAILTVSKSDWYAADNEVAEYWVDAKVLSEITEVCRKYHMNRWSHRNISKMFVADGANYSYSFVFENTDFRFSSQMYLGRYRKGTEALDEIVEKYMKTGEKIPGLVTSEQPEGEEFGSREPEPGIARLEVYEYSRYKVYYRLLNGLEEETVLENKVLLRNEETGEERELSSWDYGEDCAVEAGEIYETGIELDELLSAGKYTLTVGAYAAAFEIR